MVDGVSARISTDMQTTTPATAPSVARTEPTLHATPLPNTGNVRRLASIFEGRQAELSATRTPPRRKASENAGGGIPTQNGGVAISTPRRALSEVGTAATSTARIREGLDELNEMDRPTVGSPEKGREIGDTFTLDGRTIGTETATRSDTVSAAIKSLTDRKAHLEDRLRHNPDNIRLQRQYQNTVNQLAQAREIQDSGGTWAGSSSYRQHITRFPTLQKAWESYVPLVVNHRIQKVRNALGQVVSSLNRSGAIHDYRHGHTNLQELRELKGLFNQKALLSLQQMDTLNRMDPNIVNEYIQGNFAKASELLDGQIIDRQLILENQALQDLAAHFEGLSPEELQQLPPEVVFGRMSMLNGHNKPKKSEGFELNEANQMRDMAAIYGDLQDKKLVFDGKGPYLDQNGLIHMPFKAAGPGGEPLVRDFKPIFFNMSAQGNIKNEGPQQPINAEAYRSLSSRVLERCDQLDRLGTPEAKQKAAQMRQQLLYIGKELEKGVTDGFELAEQTTLLLQDLGAKISINCFSGKDRTGLLAALVTFKHLKDGLAGLNPAIGDRKTLSTLGKFGRQLMSVTGTAARVVEDNTKFTALKLSVFNIKLLNVGTRSQKLLGVAVRLNELYAAGATFFTKGKGEIGAGHV